MSQCKTINFAIGEICRRKRKSRQSVPVEKRPRRRRGSGSGVDDERNSERRGVAIQRYKNGLKRLHVLHGIVRAANQGSNGKRAVGGEGAELGFKISSKHVAEFSKSVGDSIGDSRQHRRPACLSRGWKEFGAHNGWRSGHRELRPCRRFPWCRPAAGLRWRT